MPHKPVNLPEGLARDHPGANRRASVRFRCTRPLPRRMALAESYSSLNGWLVDISVSGVGLLLEQSLEMGTLLFVELEATPSAPPVELLATVVRVTATPEGEWLIGCELVNRLSETDLQAILL